MKRNKISILATLLFASASVLAQNPGVNSVQVQPAPLLGVGSPCVLSFNIGNYGAGPINGTAASRRMGFVASFTKCEPVPNSIAALGGSILSAFDVVYDPINHSFIGTQKANVNIPALAVYNVNIDAVVTTATPITNLSIGVAVNIQPAPFYSLSNAPGDDYAAAFTYTGFPLNIGQVDFDLISNNCEALLKWTVAKSDNLSSFEIFESLDGAQYNSISTISAEAAKLDYSYAVPHQVGGMKYYYIMVKNKSGEVLKTSTKIIKLDCNPMIISLAPNPTADYVTLKFNALKKDRLTVKVFDDIGKLVQVLESETEIGSNATIVDLSKYANGNYLVKCIIGTSHTQTFIVTKQ
jgi:hypothetical protein